MYMPWVFFFWGQSTWNINYTLKGDSAILIKEPFFWQIKKKFASCLCCVRAKNRTLPSMCSPAANKVPHNTISDNQQSKKIDCWLSEMTLMWVHHMDSHQGQSKDFPLSLSYSDEQQFKPYITKCQSKQTITDLEPQYGSLVQCDLPGKVTHIAFPDRCH